MPLYDLPLADLRNHRCTAPPPADLDEFWQGALAVARARISEPVFVPYEEAAYGQIAVDDVTFSGADGHPIKAWFLRPRGTTGRLPCRVTFIGYGGGRNLPLEHALYAGAGYAVLVMDSRSQGGEWKVGHTPDPGAGFSGPEHPGVLTRGVLDPETYYFRRLYVDAVRAVETAAAHPQVDPDRVAVSGASQGGGLSLAAAALAPELVRLCHADIPFLCDIERAITLAPDPPYTELAAYLALHTDLEDGRRAHRALHRQRVAGAAHPVPDAHLVRPDGHRLPALDGVRRVQRDHRGQGHRHLHVRGTRDADRAPGTPADRVRPRAGLVAVAPRVLRVFISSTFRDMQGEREELVKRVFPEIRHLCEERGVVWGEVDLRWGVTDEQKAEDAVLPICLAEIERTRPYFIGMLGDRYGWVPDEIPRDLADREAWLTDDKGRSVTEMEILHGVLRSPEMAGHAFFYLRDPAWTTSLPEAERATYEEASAEGRERLVDLKERVRKSGFPVRDYPDPRGIGELVRRRPAGPRRPAVSGRRDAGRAGTGADRPGGVRRVAGGQYHRAPGRSRRRRCAVDADAPGVVVSGAPGGGVSTLLAASAAERRERHPDELVISYFVDAPARRGSGARAARLPVPGARRRGAPGDLRGRVRTLLEQACRDAPRRARDRRPAPHRGGRRRRRVAAVAAARPAATRGRHAGPVRPWRGSCSAASVGSTCSSSTRRSGSSRRRPSCTPTPRVSTGR